MVKTLVLVRHGKAQSHSKGLEDAVRTLTPAGLRAIKATYAKTFSLLDKDDVHLWSSPYLRAFQTAQVIADLIEDGNIEGHYSLTRYTCDEFLDELVHTEDRTVIAVGHNPFMEELLFRLLGFRMSFEKGSVAAIRLNMPEDGAPITPEDLVGELLWFVKGPDWRCWLVLQQISDDIKAAADGFDSLVKSGFTAPPDHQTLRATVEQGELLRAYFSFVRPFARERSIVGMIEYLDGFLKKLYRLYSFDLLCQEISQHPATYPFRCSQNNECPALAEPLELSLEERLCAPDPQPTLYEHAHEVRNKCWTILQDTLTSKKSVKRFDSFIEAAENLKWRHPIEEGGLKSEELEHRFQMLLERLIGEWETVRFGDAQATLRLCLDMMRIQLIAQSLGSVADCHTDDIPHSLTASHEDISELCDVRDMLDTLDSVNSAAMYGEATYQFVSLRAYLSGQEDRLVARLEAARR